MYEIVFPGEKVGKFMLMFTLGYANQVIAYAPIDYAIYKSSPKEAIAKSYEINKNWLAVNIALYTILFLLASIFLIGGIILLSDAQKIAINIGIKEWGTLGFALWGGFMFFAFALFYAIPAFSLAISNLMIYVLYNNTYKEGNLETSKDDLGFPSIIHYLDIIGEKIAGYTDFSSVRRYNYIPLKDKYNVKSLIINNV